MNYTYKMVKQITEMTSKKATENVLYIVLATLSDRYKFDAKDLEKFMAEVTAASRLLGDYVTREDLKAIIEKQTGIEV